MILHYGFELREEAQHMCQYTQNPNSMMHTLYHCSFFVAVKKDAPLPAQQST